MSNALQRDIGAFTAACFGMAPLTAVASSTGDAASTGVYYGAAVDRYLHSRRYLSAKILYPINFILGSATGGPTASVTLTPGVQDSADGVTWTNYATDHPGVAQQRYVAGTSASSASSTGTPATGEGWIASHNVNLSRARRYVRSALMLTVGSSSTASGAPGASVAAAWLFGGADAVVAT